MMLPFRSLQTALQKNTPSLPTVLAAALLLCPLVPARAQSILNDSSLSDYGVLNRTDSETEALVRAKKAAATPATATKAKTPASPRALEGRRPSTSASSTTAPDPIGKTAPAGTPLEVPPGVKAPATAAKSRPVQTESRVPLVAVLDFNSDTLKTEGIDTIAQAVWSELQRSGRVQMISLQDTRVALASANLTPTDPYRPVPPRLQMASALRADYLITGSVSVFEDNYVLETQVFSAADNNVIRSRNAITANGFAGLMKEVPGLITPLLDGLPRKVTPVFAATTVQQPVVSAVPAATGAPASLPNYTPHEQSPQNHELETLRAENEQLRRRLEALEPGTNKAGWTNGFEPIKGDETAKTPDSTKPLAPVQHGDKAPLKQKTPVAGPIKKPTPKPVEIAASLPDKPVTSVVRETSTKPELPVQPTPTTTPTPAPTPQSKPLETPKPTPSPSPQPTPQPTPERAVETPKVPEPAHTPEIPKAETPKPATASSAGNAEAKKLFEESEKLPTSNKGGIAALEKALTLDPNNPTYQRQMVVRLYDTGEYALAAQRGDAFAKRGSTDVDMNLYIGAAYSRLGRHREALDAANRVLTVSKNNGYALFNRALNLKALGDPKATDAYKTFMEQCGSDPAFANYTEPAKAALKELEGK